jgi:hypothetical protein
VSGINLCLKNGSWVDYKELNLYPLDAGTDSGITYMVSGFNRNYVNEILVISEQVAALKIILSLF